MIRANIYTIPTLEDSYNIDNVITTLTSRCDDKELAREIIVDALMDWGFNMSSGMFDGEDIENYIGECNFKEIISEALDSLAYDGKYFDEDDNHCNGYTREDIDYVCEKVNDTY